MAAELESLIDRWRTRPLVALIEGMLLIAVKEDNLSVGHNDLSAVRFQYSTDIIT